MEMPVICRSDFSYAQRPISFQWGGENIQIEHVISEWFVPDGKCFYVKTFTDQFFELNYNIDGDVWKINEV